ncbi:nucleotidyltransferase [Thermincola ferriacetica]|uniref:Nucleotidyltransferase n=1 Tax=Thermincola ferriacetica TaxID=281456 RepID=A0A0L6W4J6_9FIRM|nr:sugar phosphate nucleotidyltransferase [Thermincola ferriacetica]KNZ70492.1 nucleotidyltransferase [Thermincola ferriacetica]
MKAVIMAGGQGSRLRPLTCNKPKPMVPVLNKPVMEYAIELLRKHGITEIAVTLQYLPDKIKEYFGDGLRYGVQLHYFEETIPLGTAGSVRNAAEFLDETFLVISGDGITDYDLTKAVAYHKEKKGIVTLVLAKVANPLEYGVVMCDDSGKIIRFLEKPSWGEVFSDTVNTGIYVIEPEIFNYFDKDIFFDFSKDLFPLLMEKGRELYGYIATGYWSDIGSLEQYRQTHFDLLDGLVNVPLKVRMVEDGLWIGENTEIHPGVKFTGRPVYIGDNCYIDQDVELGEYTIIGNNNTIRNKASIKRSILWDYNYIDQNVELRGAVVCHHNRVQSNTSVFEGAVIGDDCFLGNRVMIKPQVKLWPEKIVEDNSVVNTSLIWSDVYRRNLFAYNGISGIVNVEVTPDMAVKLALAYGASIPVNTRVVVGSDYHSASQVMKKAIKAGLLAAGITVHDIGICRTPVSRFAVKQLAAKGGLHIRMLPPVANHKILIEILDENGINIGKDVERKIENAFYQEDFRRAIPRQLGEIRYMTGLCDGYIDTMLQSVAVEQIRARRYKVLLAYDSKNTNCSLPEVLEKLGCRLTTVHFEDYSPESLSSLVLQNSMDLAIYLNSNADLAVFISDDGQVITDENLLCLWTYIVFKSGQSRMLGVPITAPSIIERIAEQYNGEIVRTRANPRAMMEVTKDSLFQPYFDGVYMGIKLIEFLAMQNKKLSEVLRAIPQPHLHKQLVQCPWGAKGTVMRRLIEEIKGEQVELIDGIKIYHKNGWALILPDHEEPVFRVLSEANNDKTAEEIAATYAHKIENYRSAI